MATPTRGLQLAGVATIAAVLMAGSVAAAETGSATATIVVASPSEVTMSADWNAALVGWSAPQDGPVVADAAAHIIAAVLASPALASTADAVDPAGLPAARALEEAVAHGDTVVPVAVAGAAGLSALAAMGEDRLAIVVANTDAADVTVAMDLRALTGFEAATAVPWTTTDAVGRVEGAAIDAVDGDLTVTIPGASVTTFAITPAAQVAPQAAPLMSPLAASASDVVGEPRLVLIESNHARGRVLEIGNGNAQLTLPGGTTPAAAASFAIGATAREVLDQAVVAYPVTGATDTYVLTNKDGSVLVRRDNADVNFRYLALSNETVDEAAVNPYAQWRLVDAGGGWAYLQNVQAYGSGAKAALDMYNWKNENAAEIQTYDAGSAAVQKWRLLSLVPTIESTTGLVTDGSAPMLPTSLTATYSFGIAATLADVTWDLPEQSVWAGEGTVVIAGKATGYFGEELAVQATYVVGRIGNAVPSAMSGYAGIQLKELQMVAPLTVERTISGSATTVTAPVTWDWSSVTDDKLATVGTFEVQAIESAGFDAVLTVTIAPATTVNVLRSGIAVHSDSLISGAATPLMDGSRTSGGLYDWRSGGATNRLNPDSVVFYFDVPQQVTGVGVFALINDAQNRNIGSITVQYRNLTGGWVDLPTEAGWPLTNSELQLNAIVNASEPVIATGARVKFWNKNTSTWMALSEVEIYGPKASA